ncbi:MAG: hypothetical protein H7235_02530 [Bdellovibrionaceae bacterium]|nr:hypothetical protein [Pseudobdellovibrionaceae bacterium]
MPSHFANRFTWTKNENESFRHLYFGCTIEDFQPASDSLTKNEIDLNSAYAADEAELAICMWLEHIKNVLIIRHIDQDQTQHNSNGIMFRTNINYKRIDSKNGASIRFEFPNEALPKTFISITEAADWLLKEVKRGLINW